MPVSPGTASHSPHKPTTSNTENPAIHGFRGNPASAIEPRIGARIAAISSAPPVA